MNSPRWIKRFGASLLIGGQAITSTVKGRINKSDLTDQLMEAGPGSFLIVLITGIAAGTVFNIQVAFSEIQDCNKYEKLSKDYLKCQKDNLVLKTEDSGITDGVKNFKSSKTLSEFLKKE